MTEQRIQNDAIETAQRLVEQHGWRGAVGWVVAEMDYGQKDRQGFWLAVWRELKPLRHVQP